MTRIIIVLLLSITHACSMHQVRHGFLKNARAFHTTKLWQSTQETFAIPTAAQIKWIAEDRKAFEINPDEFQINRLKEINEALDMASNSDSPFHQRNNDLLSTMRHHVKNGILVPRPNIVLGVENQTPKIIAEHMNNALPIGFRRFKGILPFDLPFISLVNDGFNAHSAAYDDPNRKILRAYIMPLRAALPYQNLGAFRRQSAILKTWSNLQGCVFGRLLQGTFYDLMLGIAAPKASSVKDDYIIRQALQWGISPNQLVESLDGGGMQICVLQGGSDCFTYGKTLSTLSGRYAGHSPKRNGADVKEKPLFENPLILNSDNARQHDVSSHLYNTARWEAEAFMLSLLFGAPIYQLCD